MANFYNLNKNKVSKMLQGYEVLSSIILIQINLH